MKGFQDSSNINDELLDPENNPTEDGDQDKNKLEVRFLSIHEAIDEAGGFGKFQFLFVPLAGIGFISNGFFVHNLNYLTLLPELMWPDGMGGQRPWIDKAAGRYDTYCTNDGQLADGVSINYNSERTLTNWMSDMNMYCSSSLEISLFGSLFFFGILFCPIGLRFANIYGRKPIYVIGWFASLAIWLGLVFINNAIARYILMFLYGFWSFRNIQGYILATELSPKKLKLLVWSLIFTLDLSQVLFISIYFKFITKNYIYFFYGAIGVTVVMTITSLFVPESPVFLYEKGKCEQARTIINKMAKMNGSKLAEEQWVLDKEEISAYAPIGREDLLVNLKSNNGEKSKFSNTMKPLGNHGFTFETTGDLSPPASESPIQMMKNNPQLFLNMVALTMSWIAISFSRYLIAFNMKHLPGNIFVNAGISPIADIIGSLLCIPVQKYTSTKITFMGSFLMSFIFGFALIFVSTSWLVPVLIVFAKIGLSSGHSLWYYMMTEYLPSLFLAFAFSLTQFASRSVTILSFPLSELKAPVPMILFSITPSLSFILLWLFAKAPKNEDEKRKESMTLEVDQKMRNSMREFSKKLSLS